MQLTTHSNTTMTNICNIYKTNLQCHHIQADFGKSGKQIEHIHTAYLYIFIIQLFFSQYVPYALFQLIHSFHLDILQFDGRDENVENV